MRWRDLRRSTNVEDRRGMGGGGLAIGGGGIVIVLLISLLFGVNPLRLLEQMQGGTSLQVPSQTQTAPNATQDEAGQFVSAVLAETEDVWRDQFQRMGLTYQEPKLVLFTGRVESACGLASAAVGPFYCPQDSRVYLDLEFFELLKQRFGAPGDFAQAYVIAHEVGHHVQNLMGIAERVHGMRGRVSEGEFNALSVRLELQADFFAGVWAHHTDRLRKVLEPGDIEEALNAASAIGDDRLQMETKGVVVPDAFTHGTSEQRVRWFRRGYETGDVQQGNTFEAEAL